VVTDLGPVPKDLDAETAVIGDLLALPDTTGEVASLLTREDFNNPVCGEAFDALVKAWKRGRRHDPTSLRDALSEAGWNPDPKWVADIVSSGSGAWRNHADTVIRMRARRSILAALGDASADARTPGLDPFEVIDTLQARLSQITHPVAEPTKDLYPLDDFIDAPEHVDPPWVVPGLLKRGWRIVVVAGEGVGKSVLWRQFAVLAAQGVHPLAFYLCDPVRTLLVDLENPADAITKSCRSLREALNPDMYEPGRAWIWHRPQGIDLRTRATRAEFEANLAACRPDLVCLGPLYKAYSRKGSETDEDATRDVQEMLDDLRTRYEFALLLEHHAPQDTGGHRNLRPYGSSLWLRWPELGIAMRREDPSSERRDVELERWRGDRMSNEWPKRLVQGGQWPWVAEVS
jgi:hypothetical protein